MEKGGEMRRRVCVTGAAGYIATWLVRKLLERGCAVHATLRNLRKRMQPVDLSVSVSYHVLIGSCMPDCRG